MKGLVKGDKIIKGKLIISVEETKRLSLEVEKLITGYLSKCILLKKSHWLLERQILPLKVYCKSLEGLTVIWIKVIGFP